MPRACSVSSTIFRACSTASRGPAMATVVRSGSHDTLAPVSDSTRLTLAPLGPTAEHGLRCIIRVLKVLALFLFCSFARRKARVKVYTWFLQSQVKHWW